MSRFVSNETKKIDLGDGEWVKIKKEYSFKDIQSIMGLDQKEMSINVLLIALKEWNLKDEKGKDVELSMENILNLNLETIKLLSEEITSIIDIESIEAQKKS